MSSPWKLTWLMGMNRLGRCTTGITVLVFALAFGANLQSSAFAASPTSPGQQAAEVLRTSGVTGGLVVHIGCGDGRLTVALRANDRYLVHGLDADARHVQKARQNIRAAGLYGPVAVEQWVGERLPYADSLVNLAVVESPELVAAAELMRVLVPGGVALIRQKDGWKKLTKDWSADLGEWTHFLHGADNNAVARDQRVGPPRRLQWLAEPRFARSHEHLASISVVVSAGGRLFAIVDEGPTESVVLPSKWRLVARDAFNGVLLWKRPIRRWESQLRGFRTGPPQVQRRLVAVGNRVYVTLGYGEPISVLDAATGRTLQVFEGTEGTEEITFRDGRLYLLLGEERGSDSHGIDSRTAERRGQKPVPTQKTVAALDAASGRWLWRLRSDETVELLPTTLTVGHGRLFFHNLNHLVCVDTASGKVLWRTERRLSRIRPGWSVPTVVAYQDVVLSADRSITKKEQQPPTSPTVQWIIDIGGGGAPGELIAYSADTGERLWSTPCAEGYNAPVDVFVADGLVWVGTTPRRKGPDFLVGRDPRTGEVKRRIDPSRAYTNPGMPHHRCYRNKATDRFIFGGRAGVELIDLRSGQVHRNQWIRGTCQHGVLPCNGLLYTPPDSCACFIQAKLPGFKALASAASNAGAAKPKKVDRLQRGPAYAEFSTLSSQPSSRDRTGDWPTYRHDAARSGFTSEPVPANLQLRWKVRLPGRLSAPTIADGKVFVSSIDQHTVHALDAATGRLLWSFTAGGRVDSPPTFYRGRVLFGSADGWVYCLRAADGALAWRFRAAPEQRRIVAFGQVESAWPVPGSVLIVHDVAYCVAGRSSVLDGGMYLYRLDPQTGRELSVTPVRHIDPKTGEQQETIRGFGMEGALVDVLSSDGTSVFLKQHRFDLEGRPQDRTVPHLFTPTGFLDDTWWHRTYWLFGTEFLAGWSGWWQMGNQTPAGRLLVFNEQTIYGYGRSFYPGGNAGQWNRGERYRLFAAPKSVASVTPRSAETRRGRPPQGQKARKGRKGRGRAERRNRPPQNRSLVQCRWSVEPPYEAKALLLAADTLFLAGPPADAPFSIESLEGRNGVRLLAVSAEDGRIVSEWELEALPVLDGLAAAYGRLYLTLQSGELICFGR
ncbi:MAG: PQQ-binding-like beta-propeller repeat protein [Planctomycetes bacterium]|nr:PQQ-binding-like beta-propeller repeat protein [Planctomycetota bacterium]